MRPNVMIINTQNGEILNREMTDEEFEIYVKEQSEIANELETE